MNRVLIETSFHEIGFHRQPDNRIIIIFFFSIPWFDTPLLFKKKNSKKNILSKIIEIRIPNKITRSMEMLKKND